MTTVIFVKTKLGFLYKFRKSLQKHVHAPDHSSWCTSYSRGSINWIIAECSCDSTAPKLNLIRAKSTSSNSAGVLCSPQAKMRPIEQVRDPSLNVERDMCFWELAKLSSRSILYFEADEIPFNLLSSTQDAQQYHQTSKLWSYASGKYYRRIMWS